MVYGVVWNPLKPHDGRRGSEFASYGVKHLKVGLGLGNGCAALQAPLPPEDLLCS